MIVAGIFIFALVVFVLFLVKRKKNRREINETHTELKEEEQRNKDYNVPCYSRPVHGGFYVSDVGKGVLV